MDKKYLKSTTIRKYNTGASSFTKNEIDIGNDKMELIGMLSPSGKHLKYGSRKYIKR